MNHPTDHEDRLADLALTEIVGGQTPPDLSARIAAALAAESFPQLTPKTSMKTKYSTRRGALYALVASIALVVGAFTVTGTVNNAFVAKDTAARGLARTEIKSKSEIATPAITASKPGEQKAPQRLAESLTRESERVLEEKAAVPQAGVPMQRYNEDAVDVIVDVEEAAKSAAPASGGRPTTTNNAIGLTPLLAGELSDSAGAAVPASTAPQAEQAGVTEMYFRDPISQSYDAAGMPIAGGSISNQPADRFAGGAATQPRWGWNGGSIVGESRRLQAAEWPSTNRGFDFRGRDAGLNGDKYTAITENAFIETRGEQALSTFSIDVDTASYANVRQFLTSGQLPPPDAVRLEELINYFDYHYAGPAPNDQTPFASHLEVAACPWAPAHRLVRIGVKGRDVQRDKRPLSNLVFLVDVSGSMAEPNKLPLVRHGLMQLARQLGENDRVAIVVYASSEGLVLDSTLGSNQQTILSALEKLEAGGSTAGGAGIQLAYQIAEDHFIPNGVNRVILCTDGDFNVGVTNTADLQRMVEQKAKETKVSLSVLGFGRGNLNDTMMQTIANNGNGEHYYIDTEREAKKVFVDGLSSTLVTIAKDVKIQVEFNPAKVAGYRLLGYENRLLAAQDFNNDEKDAGEIGAGHTVTALYEIIPAGQAVPAATVDALKYQQPAGQLKEEVAPTATQMSDELLTLKMRYKQPTGDVSQKLEWPLRDTGASFASATPDFQFAAAVASFGMLLRNSQYKGDASYNAVIELATPGAKQDEHGYRAEFLELVRKARDLTPR